MLKPRLIGGLGIKYSCDGEGLKKKDFCSGWARGVSRNQALC